MFDTRAHSSELEIDTSAGTFSEHSTLTPFSLNSRILSDISASRATWSHTRSDFLPASAHELGVDLRLEQARLFAKGIGMLGLPQCGKQQRIEGDAGHAQRKR